MEPWVLRLSESQLFRVQSLLTTRLCRNSLLSRLFCPLAPLVASLVYYPR